MHELQAVTIIRGRNTHTFIVGQQVPEKPDIRVAGIGLEKHGAEITYTDWTVDLYPWAQIAWVRKVWVENA